MRPQVMELEEEQDASTPSPPPSLLLPQLPSSFPTIPPPPPTSLLLSYHPSSSPNFPPPPLQPSLHLLPPTFLLPEHPSSSSPNISPLSPTSLHLLPQLPSSPSLIFPPHDQHYLGLTEERH
ncbi:hypothetical protein Pcinc_011262 [Petrolisthes cinctipes]|uniref:Uncharacterized protein n=1 Tax=Petrolisthes cinctipes TaxID=88211 RepID=A0AAE1G1B7_PETCI|nr:hypothetical protein Pcinc_011262 [Petrolisthes cinctipes]